jgi:hypothetical protein
MLSRLKAVLQPALAAAVVDRGRKGRLSSTPPPSEPDGRFSRIRLSSRWSYLEEDWTARRWAAFRLNNPRSVK